MSQSHRPIADVRRPFLRTGRRRAPRTPWPAFRAVLFALRFAWLAPRTGTNATP